jgi:hypothetical protein
MDEHRLPAPALRADSDTFIGRLYAHHFGEENAMQEAVNA